MFSTLGRVKKDIEILGFQFAKISLLFSVHHLFSLCLADWLLSQDAMTPLTKAIMTNFSFTQMKIEKMPAVRKNISKKFSSLFQSPEPGIHQIRVPLTNEVSCCTDALNLPSSLLLSQIQIAKVKHSVVKFINFEMAAEHHF